MQRLLEPPTQGQPPRHRKAPCSRSQFKSRLRFSLFEWLGKSLHLPEPHRHDWSNQMWKNKIKSLSSMYKKLLLWYIIIWVDFFSIIFLIIHIVFECGLCKVLNTDRRIFPGHLKKKKKTNTLDWILRSLCLWSKKSIRTRSELLFSFNQRTWRHSTWLVSQARRDYREQRTWRAEHHQQVGGGVGGTTALSHGPTPLKTTNSNSIRHRSSKNHIYFFLSSLPHQKNGALGKQILSDSSRQPEEPPDLCTRSSLAYNAPPPVPRLCDVPILTWLHLSEALWWLYLKLKLHCTGTLSTVLPCSFFSS